MRDRGVAIAGLALAALPAGLPLGAPPSLRWAAALLSVALGWVATPATRGLAASLACLVVAELVPLPALLGIFSWQIRMSIALLSWAAIARAHAPARASSAWRDRGTVPVWMTVAVAAVTPVGLGGWLVTMRPDLSDIARAIPAVPLALVLAGAAVFAVVNATLEELVWRGVLQDRLIPAFGPIGAVLLQAASFGAQHAHGIPRGIVGVLLAGGWAVLLGLLRRRAGGLLAPVLAHVVADTTIAILVLTYAR